MPEKALYSLRVRQEAEKNFAQSALDLIASEKREIHDALVVPCGILALLTGEQKLQRELAYLRFRESTWVLESCLVFERPTIEPPFRMVAIPGRSVADLYTVAFAQMRQTPNRCMHLPSLRRRPSVLEAVGSPDAFLSLLRVSTGLDYVDYLRSWPRTVLHLASIWRSPEIFDFLLRSGADPTLCIDGYPCAGEVAIGQENEVAVAAFIEAAKGKEAINWWQAEGIAEAKIAGGSMETVVRTALLKRHASSTMAEILAELNVGVQDSDSP